MRRLHFLIVATYMLSWQANATFVDPADFREAKTTYSLRELADVLPVLTKGAVGHKCELQVVPKSNSLIINLKSANPTWGVFEDSFELTGAKAEGYANDFSSADTWLDARKIRNLHKIQSLQRAGKIERSVTFAIDRNGFSVAIAKDVVDDSLNVLNSIEKCFFTYSK